MASSGDEVDVDELVRRGVEAYNSGNLDAVLPLLAPNVEVHASAAVLNAGTFHGPDGFMQWITAWNEAWEEFTLEIRDMELVTENSAIVTVRQRGVGAGSGVEVELEVFHVWELRDGLVSRLHLYATRDDALAAAKSWG